MRPNAPASFSASVGFRYSRALRPGASPHAMAVMSPRGRLSLWSGMRGIPRIMLLVLVAGRISISSVRVQGLTHVRLNRMAANPRRSFVLPPAHPQLSLRGGQDEQPADLSAPGEETNTTRDGDDEMSEQEDGYSDVEFLDPNEMIQLEDDEGHEFEFDDWNEGEEEGEEDERMVSGEEGEEDDGEGSWKDEQLREYKDESLRCFPHNEPVYAVALSPFNSDLVAAGGGDDCVRLWGNAGVGPEGQLLAHFNDSVTAIAFSHDGTYVAGASLDGTARVWLADSGEEACRLAGAEGLVWLEWHPRGPVLLGGTEDGLAFMWDISHDRGVGGGEEYYGRCLQVFAGHPDMVTCGGFADMGRLVVTGGQDGFLRIFSPKTGKMLHSLHDALNLHSDSVTALACHPHQAICVSGDKKGGVAVVQVQQGRILLRLPNDHSRGHSDSIEGVAICKLIPGLAATASMDGTARLWDLSTGTERARCAHQGEGVTALRWSPHTPLLVTGSSAGTVRLWNGFDGTLLRVLSGHKDAITDLAVSRDGGAVLAASMDKTARLFTLSSAKRQSSSSGVAKSQKEGPEEEEEEEEERARERV